MSQIFVGAGVTSSDVVLVDGECCRMVGDSDVEPDTFSVDGEFTDCDDCGPCSCTDTTLHYKAVLSGVAWTWDAGSDGGDTTTIPSNTINMPLLGEYCVFGTDGYVTNLLPGTTIFDHYSGTYIGGPGYQWDARAQLGLGRDCNDICCWVFQVWVDSDNTGNTVKFYKYAGSTPVGTYALNLTCDPDDPATVSERSGTVTIAEGGSGGTPPSGGD